MPYDRFGPQVDRTFDGSSEQRPALADPARILGEEWMELQPQMDGVYARSSAARTDRELAHESPAILAWRLQHDFKIEETGPSRRIRNVLGRHGEECAAGKTKP